MEYSFVPKGAASFNLEYDLEPKDFYFLLMPNLTMLALSAAVEPLRIANQVTEKCLYRWYTLTESGKPITCSNGLRIIPDIEVPADVVDGYSFLCSGISPETMPDGSHLNWVRRQAAFGKSVGGICTGAFMLAKAGLLKNKKFTLHWENQPAFIEHFPQLKPSSNLYEMDGNVLTCGGGAAATDMILDIIERDHGSELALIVADMCIHGRSYSPKALQKSANSAVIGTRNKGLLNAIKTMQQNLEEPLDLEVISDQANISRRQLERLFKKYTTKSPHHFYRDLRLERAHALLSETNMSITEIATATGFTSTVLGRCFRQKYGVTPSGFKKHWSEVTE